MKKTIIKLLPKTILKFLEKRKYRANNLAIHKRNIEEDKIAKIVCRNQQKYNFLKSTLLNSFLGTIRVSGYNIYFHPIAIIAVPDTIEEYLKLIGAKSRNMNKKAQKNGIECRLFDWNDYLDDIYSVNTSASIRQGRKMDSAYIEYPKRVENSDIEDFKIRHIGAFVEEQLVGYIELYIYGNFAMTNRILGHKEYLKFGVMNLMIKQAVEYAIEDKIEYINYLTMQNRKSNSLSAFKYRVGFREYSLLELA